MLRETTITWFITAFFSRCVPLLAQTTMGKADFLLKILYLFPHLSGAGRTFNWSLRWQSAWMKSLHIPIAVDLAIPNIRPQERQLSLVPNFHKPMAVLVLTGMAAWSIKSWRITRATAVQIKWNVSLVTRKFSFNHMFTRNAACHLFWARQVISCWRKITHNRLAHWNNVKKVMKRGEPFALFSYTLFSICAPNNYM